MLKHSYVSGKVKVNRSGIDHRGVFAVKPISKNEIIAVWGGFIISQSEFVKLEKTCFKKIENYATKVADGFFLVSCKKGGLEDDDFFNHSCSPNAGIKGHLVIAAMRDIPLGEEVTYDYCMTDADFDYSFKCRCGSPRCRGLVTTKDWMQPLLQRKYKGYFSWYVQEKIDEMRREKLRSRNRHRTPLE
ncbi:MAG: SET domain-containing protein-lysine N-methyltransferase [Candidatus Omnitrophota bacterium]